MCRSLVTLIPPCHVIPQATTMMRTFHDNVDGIAALKPLLKEVRVSGKLILGGADIVSVEDAAFSLGPLQIVQTLVEEAKSDAAFELTMDGISFADVVKFSTNGLSAAFGEDNKVWQLGQLSRE